MAVFHIHCLAFAVLILAGISCSGHRVAAAPGCQADIKSVISQCKNYIQKPGPTTPPALICCAVIQAANLPCVCKYITKEVEKTISMEKVVSVSRYCGKRLPHGSKCGSYTIP